MPDSIIQFRDAQTLAAVILKAVPGGPSPKRSRSRA